jgi:hypothetical protein
MVGAQSTVANVCIEGSAIYHTKTLSVEAVPDASRLSCNEDTILIEVPEADFRIDLQPASRSTRIRLQATFRENRPAGGTWWSSWEVYVHAVAWSPQVTTVLVREVSESRRRFARALADA